MAFFIAGDCLDILDKSCTEECPVDCIYEGKRKLYINPNECIDCGACEPVCPVTAIHSDLHTTDDTRIWQDDNATFFDTTLTGRTVPLGDPGGASASGPVGADTQLAASTTQPSP